MELHHPPASRPGKHGIVLGRVLSKAQEALDSLFADWLKPCSYADARIAEQEKSGYEVAGVKEFREACDYVRRRARKIAMHEEIENAFRGGIFDDTFWQ
jgi:hypothetical protein